MPGKLIEQGRYNDAVGLEHTFNEAIKTIEIPVTILCLYNSINANYVLQISVDLDQAWIAWVNQFSKIFLFSITKYPNAEYNTYVSVVT